LKDLRRLALTSFRRKPAFSHQLSYKLGLTNEAKYFVIATGSSPAIISLPGIETVPYLTNETIFDLKKNLNI
jgi:pyruvate/2-oxoglutarate dehydrogenase complex dihydrolipoamide dehydrogenase (E3) component